MAARSSRGTEHSERLKRSASILDFEIPYSVAEIDAAKRLVLEKNNQKDAYVRPIAWRGSEQLGVTAQNNTIHLAIATWEWPSYFDPAQRLKGIRLDLAEYRRPDPETAPALAKAAGLYMICTISKHRAERKGYADAMMLDWQGRVAECTGANIFFIKDGKIHTPIADCFLAGITRATAIVARQAARHRGDRAPHHAGRACRLLGMLHHRHRGRGDGRVRDRAWKFTPGAHHQAVDGRLHRRGAAQGQGRRGIAAMNLALWLERVGLSHGDRPALGVGARVVRNYAEVAGRVARLAASLRQRFGLVPGERVAIVAKNSPDYLELMFGIWHARIGRGAGERQAARPRARLYPRTLRRARLLRLARARRARSRRTRRQASNG